MRRLLTVVALAAVVVFPAGCSKKQPSGNATLPPVTVTTSATPSPTGAPSPTAPVCVGAVSGGENPSAAVLKAWLCGDAATMHAKMIDTAFTQLNAVPKDIDMHWTYILCEGAAGSSYCNYRNSLGSELIVRSQNAPPGKVTEVRFDRTVYNTDPVAYTKAFVDAWIAGNLQRMQALGTAGVASFAATHPVPTLGYAVAMSGPGKYKVTSSGGNYVFTLQTSQLGKANAITDLYPG